MMSKLEKSLESSESLEEELRELYVILQPTRLKILQSLLGSPPRYIEQIARQVKENRKNIAFHLTTLEAHCLVECTLGIVDESHKLLGRYYRITEKALEILEGRIDLRSLLYKSDFSRTG